MFLTGILIPNPLLPTLARRRRYLAFSDARDVERTQTIKRNSHSSKNIPKPKANTRSDMCSRKGFIQGKGSWVEGTYLEASISTRLAGNPSRHLTQCATWPALLRAGSGILSPDTPVPTDVDPGDGDDIKKVPR